MDAGRKLPLLHTIVREHAFSNVCINMEISGFVMIKRNFDPVKIVLIFFKV